MRPMSPSVAFGCIELLSVAERYPISPGAVHSLSLGAVPSQDILDAALDIRWLSISVDGFLRPTSRGDRALAAPCSRAKLRTLVLDYIEARDPPWLQLASSGRREVLMHAPKELRQIFVEAGLAYGGDVETVAFWDDLASRARGAKDEALTEIGRTGERLTLAYEKCRTGSEPKWIALDSNSDGYDVLSCRDKGDSRRLVIEVKTTKQGLDGYFYVSRNEWEVAEDALSHVFHLWDVSEEPPLLAVLKPEDVRRHTPVDSGMGEWQSVRIPFFAFRAVFEPWMRF